MNIHITARHFKAHDTLRLYAFEAMNKLENHFDGIISADIILSYEKAKNSLKAAELRVKVRGTVLTALEKSDEYTKSIDAAAAKIERQLQRHKAKIKDKQIKVTRATRAKA